jgi:hypothetical protein
VYSIPFFFPLAREPFRDLAPLPGTTITPAIINRSSLVNYFMQN